MLSTDRKYFCPSSPYEDAPRYIGYGATISAPHMHATVLESLRTLIQVLLYRHHIGFSSKYFPVMQKPNSKVLDVGCGSGYLLVAISHLNPTSSVFGIDYISDLVALSDANIRKQVFANFVTIHLILS